MIAAVQQQTTPVVPAANHGAGKINIRGANLLFRLGTPASGPYETRPRLTYNSRTALQTEFGYGWRSSHQRSVTEIDSSSASVTDGGGAVHRFWNKDGSGVYFPPPGIINSLVQNGDGSWTETQPNGFKFQYDSTGSLVRFESLAGQRWTVSYDGAGKLAHVENPFQQRTTYSYDASDYIRRITDIAGRITTFSVDASGDLTSHTTPELCQSQLRYDAEHFLTSLIDPTEARTSYAFDSMQFVKRVQFSDGGIYTYTWEDWGTTLVTDPAGRITTVLLDVARNVSGIIDPQGQRTTYSSPGSQLGGFVDGRGNRTTFTYGRLPDHTAVRPPSCSRRQRQGLQAGRGPPPR
jgi:YD repeat-containing protein